MGHPRHHFEYDCAVIGGGPGGLVSALYLSRFKRKVVLIDSGHSRAQWIPRIRNLVGYEKGLTGPQLLEHLGQQVRQYKADWIQGEAQVKRRPGGFTLLVGKRVLSARKVILAIGMRDIQPPVLNIPELRKKGVLAYCPICDGFDHSDQHIGLLVRENHGLKKMLFLSQFTKKISVFQTEPFRISPQNLKTAKQKKIRIYKAPLKALRLRKKPLGLFVEMESELKPVAVDVAYVLLGVEFNKSAIWQLPGLKRHRLGYLLTNSHQQTSIPGLYAVGDCVHALAQVSVAVGQAALAATRIHNELGIH